MHMVIYVRRLLAHCQYAAHAGDLRHACRAKLRLCRPQGACPSPAQPNTSTACATWQQNAAHAGDLRRACRAKLRLCRPQGACPSPAQPNTSTACATWQQSAAHAGDLRRACRAKLRLCRPQGACPSPAQPNTSTACAAGQQSAAHRRASFLRRPRDRTKRTAASIAMPAHTAIVRHLASSPPCHAEYIAASIDAAPIAIPSLYLMTFTSFRHAHMPPARC
jgi:hypothetical protein